LQHTPAETPAAYRLCVIHDDQTFQLKSSPHW
jgi:hypothetical protein